MKPRTLKLNAHRVLHYYTPEDVGRMLAEARRAPRAAESEREEVARAAARAASCGSDPDGAMWRHYTDVADAAIAAAAKRRGQA